MDTATAAVNAGLDARDPGDLRRRLDRERLEVLCRDGPVACLEEPRPTLERVREVLGVDPAAGSVTVHDVVDVRHRLAEHDDRPGADVADPAAADPVLLHPQQRARCGQAAELPGAAVGLPDERREADLPARRIEQRTTVVDEDQLGFLRRVPRHDPLGDELEQVRLAHEVA